jgi:hypothetical protein
MFFYTTTSRAHDKKLCKSFNATKFRYTSHSLGQTVKQATQNSRDALKCTRKGWKITRGAMYVKYKIQARSEIIVAVENQ